jgi:hypothetical protein
MLIISSWFAESQTNQHFPPVGNTPQIIFEGRFPGHWGWPSYPLFLNQKVKIYQNVRFDFES